MRVSSDRCSSGLRSGDSYPHSVKSANWDFARPALGDGEQFALVTLQSSTPAGSSIAMRAPTACDLRRSDVIER
jgi:hypothetical protein